MKRGQKHLKVATTHAQNLAQTCDPISYHKLGGGASATNGSEENSNLISFSLSTDTFSSHTHTHGDIFTYGNHKMLTILVGKIGMLEQSANKGLK